MASRRRARGFALQALYHSALTESPVQQALTDLRAGLLAGEGTESARDEVDALIEQCSTNWRLGRMPVVDRNILRLAAYELKECADIPATVSINEAIELAKRFGTKDSRAFVNGIVDRMARQLGRIDGSRGSGRGRGRPGRKR